MNLVKRIAGAFLLIALCSLSACKSAPKETGEDVGPGMTFVLEVQTSEVLGDMDNYPNESIAEVYERTCQIIARRVDRFGVAKYSLKKHPHMDFIEVNVSGFKDTSGLINQLCGTAQLDFWLTYQHADVRPVLENINKSSDGSFSKLMMYPMDVQSPVAGTARLCDTAAVNQILRHALDDKIFDTIGVRFMWGVKPDTADIISLYAIEVTSSDGYPLLEGTCITDANYENGFNGYEVGLIMNSAGAREWKRITGENIGRCIAIVVDDKVYSAPRVNQEIAGGRSQITGKFTADEARNLSTVLKTGKLPVPVRIVKYYVNDK